MITVEQAVVHGNHSGAEFESAVLVLEGFQSGTGFHFGAAPGNGQVAIGVRTEFRPDVVGSITGGSTVGDHLGTVEQIINTVDGQFFTVDTAGDRFGTGEVFGKIFDAGDVERGAGSIAACTK